MFGDKDHGLQFISNHSIWRQFKIILDDEKNIDFRVIKQVANPSS